MKILIVDDSPTTRSFLKVLLNLESMDLLEAENGERALVIAQLVTFDLVIADVNMPKLDGIGLVERLRASSDPRLRALPVILLTADKTEDLERRGIEAGATAFARKPIQPAELSSILKNLAKGPSPSAPPSSSRGAGATVRNTPSPRPDRANHSPSINPASDRRGPR